MAEIVYDATVKFCERFVGKQSRTYEQMVQAGRSGKQNIVEGSMASGTSKKIELKLIGIARASLEELLQDFEDYLRQHNLPIWNKNDSRALRIRHLSKQTNRSYTTYKSYIENESAEVSANTIICLIHQTNFLLDQQTRKLEEQFLKEGGFTERMYRLRKVYRDKTK